MSMKSFISGFVQLTGLVIILISFVDIYMTVLYPRTGKGVISSRLYKGTWRLFRGLSRLPIKGGKNVLSYCGPTLPVVIVVVWVSGFVLGFALLIWPALGSGIQASQGKTPTDFSTALYYSGYALTTLGIGDLLPQTDVWQLITILEAAVGFTVITASLTYLLSIYTALTQRNTFALNLYHRSVRQADAAVLLVGLKGQGRFEPAAQEIPTIIRELLLISELHHAYPILHYFRFQEPKYALARVALICLDLTTLIKTALHPQAYASLINSSAVAGLESSGLDLVFQLADSFLSERYLDQPTFSKDWRSRYYIAIAYLQQHDIETVTDIQAGADHYVKMRGQWNHAVIAFAQYMDYSWHDITLFEDMQKAELSAEQNSIKKTTTKLPFIK
ncbi:MAG: potassium channel family protein [Leptolyngbyaceae cyanobacterium]